MAKKKMPMSVGNTDTELARGLPDPTRDPDDASEIVSPAPTMMQRGEKSKLSQEESDEICSRARERMTRSYEMDKENRDNARDDTLFVWKKGAQWPTDISDARNDDWQPCLELNQLPQFIKQVVNDQRQAR